MPKLTEPVFLKDDAEKLSKYVGNEERKQWIGGFPRVTYLGRNSNSQCDGFAGAVTRHGRHRCKLRAQFKFKALKRSEAWDGMFCWTHLSDQLHEMTGLEEKAVERWAKEHPPPWQPRYNEWVEKNRKPDEEA